MVDPIANAVVLIMFGLLIGVVLQVTALILPQSRKTALNAQHQPESDTETKQHGYLRRVIDRSRSAAEEGRLMSMPRSGWLAMATFYGLIAMLIIVIRYSPITMRWGYFLLSVFAGFLIAKWILNLSKAGKIGVKS